MMLKGQILILPMIRFIALLAIFSLSGLPGLAQSRYALVVGIDNYTQVPALQKAANDARAISQVLQARGFHVELALNVDQLELISAFSNFSNRIAPGDEAVFFFAGHGVEIEGRNYLLPADVPAAAPGQDILVTSRALAVDQVQTMVQARGARVSLLILDACRDNPFAREGTRTLGATRGLARPAPTEGSFIMYSAGAGEAALDRLSDTDTNANSVFTRALIPLMQEPGLDLLALTQRVRGEVRQMARSVGHDQFPAYYDQLAGSFYFTPSTAPPTPQPDPLSASGVMPAPAPVVPVQTDPCAAARQDWAVLANSSSVVALETFAMTHAACPLYAALAQDRLTVVTAPAAVPQPSISPPTVDQCFALWYERNSIFHRHSFCFQSAQARQYFDVSNCKTRNPVLSGSERARVAELQALERQNGC